MPDIDLPTLVAECRKALAHAWMVRTFVKHCEEAEDYPELHAVVRAVFDASRALEAKADDPAAFFQMLRKKLPKLKAAASQFRIDAPRVSLHTNFQQAVISLDASVERLEELLNQSESLPGGART